MNLSIKSTPCQVAAFYQFSRLDGHADWRAPLLNLCHANGLKGTILLAAEGINGTVAGPDEGISALLAFLQGMCGLERAEVKFSRTAEMPFHRMKVRLKKEIVTMGVVGVDAAGNAGAYVESAEWNALISDRDTVLVDTRNEYEVALGTFSGAIDPATRSFSDFPAWVDRHRDELAGRKVAMFCTGGIRCEKATAYVRSLGLDTVFHLKGGILKYLEEVPEGESLWRGECFVFDERVSVAHGVQVGEAELCRACRRPLTHHDRQSPDYRPGISCAYCRDARSETDRERYLERQKQVELAEKRGAAPHIGG